VRGVVVASGRDQLWIEASAAVAPGTSPQSLSGGRAHPSDPPEPALLSITETLPLRRIAIDADRTGPPRLEGGELNDLPKVQAQMENTETVTETEEAGEAARGMSQRRRRTDHEDEGEGEDEDIVGSARFVRDLVATLRYKSSLVLPRAAAVVPAMLHAGGAAGPAGITPTMTPILTPMFA